jgi:LysM domain
MTTPGAAAGPPAPPVPPTPFVVSRDRTDLPGLLLDVEADVLQPGHVFVDDGGSCFAVDDQRVVVQRTGAKWLELRTRRKLDSAQGTPQTVTVLSRNDYDALSTGTGTPTVRLYRPLRDPLAKLWSAAGVVLLLPAVLAVAAAVLSILAALAADPANSLADRQRALLAWTTQPMAGVWGSPSHATTSQAINEVRSRVIAAQWCEFSMLGHSVGPQPFQEQAAPALSTRYTVVGGDTLWALTDNEYGDYGDTRTQTLVAEVAADNQLSNPDRIVVGQVIVFPTVRYAVLPPVSCSHDARSWLHKHGLAAGGGVAALLTAFVASWAAWRRCGFQQSL